MRYHYRRKYHAAEFGRRNKPFHRFRDRFDDITGDRRIYRSRRGILFGVCRGLAEHFGLSVFWVRIAVLLVFVFTGFWPIGVIYIIAGLLLKPAPVVPLQNPADRESTNPTPLPENPPSSGSNANSTTSTSASAVWSTRSPHGTSTYDQKTSSRRNPSLTSMTASRHSTPPKPRMITP